MGPQVLEAAVPTLVCVVMTVVGLLPFMPHPHTDPDFIQNATGLLVGGVVCKLAAFALFVLPAYTGAYPVEPLTDATAAAFDVGVAVHTRAAAATTATLTATGEWDPDHPVSVPGWRVVYARR